MHGRHTGDQPGAVRTKRGVTALTGTGDRTGSDFEPFHPTDDLASDVRTLVRRAVEVYADSPRVSVSADGPHAEFLSAAAARMAATHDLDCEFIVHLIEGTVLYRSILGTVTPALVDQITGLVCGRTAPSAGPPSES